MIFDRLDPSELRSIIMASRATEKARILECRKQLQEEQDRISARLIHMAETEIEWLRPKSSG